MKFLIVTAFLMISNLLIAENHIATPLATGTPVHVTTAIRDFSVHISGNKTKLNWSVLSNDNASSIEVENSTDGKTFSQVGLVWCSEKTTTENYSLTINSKSNTYYRLKLICKDGTVVYANANGSKQ